SANACSKRSTYPPRDEIQVVSRQSRTYARSLPPSTGAATGMTRSPNRGEFSSTVAHPIPGEYVSIFVCQRPPRSTPVESSICARCPQPVKVAQTAVSPGPQLVPKSLVASKCSKRGCDLCRVRLEYQCSIGRLVGQRRHIRAGDGQSLEPCLEDRKA